MDSYLDNATDKVRALQVELIGKDNKATVSENGSEVIVTYRGKKKVLNVSTGTLSEPLTVAKAKKEGTVFNDDNTPITDKYDNTVVIPKGFKISSDSAEFVTEGIVIEDATYTNTKGSEFVWIPVSRDSTDKNKVKGATKNATILLSRYTFDDNGNPTNQESKTIDNYYTELSSSEHGVAVAKTDVNSENGFKEKTKAAGGFWIGRYEARIEGYESVNTSCPKNDPNWVGYTGGKLVEKPEAQVFNYITQKKASEMSQKMYEKENDGTTAIIKFESDLMNSYAWDTAILFLQEYDNREGTNLAPYSIQNSINTGSNSLATGTVSETNKDKICNVYDMASNCLEWTTETCSFSIFPCIKRGGRYWI